MLDINTVSKEERNDLAFQMVVAMRDTINLAKKKGYKSTYENAIRLFHDFSPELYNGIVNCLPQRNISDEAKVFIAKAEILSVGSEKPVTPLELLQTEIDELKDLLKSGSDIDQDKKKILKNKLGSLESLKKMSVAFWFSFLETLPAVPLLSTFIHQSSTLMSAISLAFGINARSNSIPN